MTIRQKFDSLTIPEPNSGCLLWLGYVAGSGYGEMQIEGKKVSAHRFSWSLVNGPIPTGMLICHKCDVRSCVNPDHLFLGTVADNIRDMVQKERHFRGQKLSDALKSSSLFAAKVLRGERQPNAVLSDERARQVYHARGTRREIGRRFGVSASTVSLIKAKKRWGHLHA